MEKKITEEMLAWLFAGKVILNLVREGAEIDNEAQLKVFALDNAAEILLEYAKHGYELFYAKAELKVFDLSNAAEILLEYVKHHYLSDKAELKVFELPDEKAAEIMLEYVKHDYWLNDVIQLKIFALPNAAEILLEYVKPGWWLCDEAELKVFDLPDEKAAEIMLEYTKRHKLCPDAQKLYDELMAKSAKG